MCVSALKQKIIEQGGKLQQQKNGSITLEWFLKFVPLFDSLFLILFRAFQYQLLHVFASALLIRASFGAGSFLFIHEKLFESGLIITPASIRIIAIQKFTTIKTTLLNKSTFSFSTMCQRRSGKMKRLQSKIFF